MGRDVLGFDEINPAQGALVGGKGAHLAALSRIDGIRVPPGFCITTEAFERLAPEALTLPDELAAQITRRLTDGVAYAVRSSATAEDLPNASFAGQHDTYLNVIGPAAVLDHVARCRASLFTARAVAYRQRQGFDARKVRMAVVVQQMVAAQAAGVLFTADPVSGNRRVAVVEAVFGLGDALVSGKVNPASYRVRDGALVSGLPAQPVLTGSQVLRLVELGRKIEAHFASPQDIEWCLFGDDFHFVQSRPITTLFPIPPASDGENHVYLSVGHQQMMTEAMKPLGLSFWRLTSPAPMVEAGGRLFVDVTKSLASPGRRAGLLELFGKTEPLVTDAVQTVLSRGFVRTIPDEGPVAPPPGGAPLTLENDPAIVTELIARAQASIDTAKRDIETKSGAELLDFIFTDLQELKRVLFDPKSSQAAMAGMQATWWLNARLQEWLGEKNAADVLTQSAPNNVTSEMGLALLDVADVVRAKPDSPEARDAISGWLEKYGMRCVGEIDLTRPRWAERPDLLRPMIQSNVKSFEPGAGRRRFEDGLKNAAKKEHELLERLRALPDGERKAEETKQMIARLRTFIGYREFPKFGMISRYFVYRQALLKEAERLVAAGVLAEQEDVYFLSLPELRDVVRTQRADGALIRQRREAFRSYQALTPPRVLTSEGECLSGSFRRDDVPQGALVGLGVSAGTVEGRARIVLDPGSAALEPGDILVTVSTDPSWTPAFVAIKGLVTEVGGLMTHGAVITREYGLPAVVGVERATSLIRDGQRIRVHGTEGYVELLS